MDILTLVFGASLKPERHSNMAIHRLREHNFEVVALGGREGKVLDVDIQKGEVTFDNIHTITMYMGAERQGQFYDYLLSLKPKRIIFNPGAENSEFVELANKENIEVIEACTLVMLSTGQYHKIEEMDGLT